MERKCYIKPEISADGRQYRIRLFLNDNTLDNIDIKRFDIYTVSIFARAYRRGI